MPKDFSPEPKMNRLLKASFLFALMFLSSCYITTLRAPVQSLTTGIGSQSYSSRISSNGELNQSSIERHYSPTIGTRSIIVILMRLNDQANSTSVAEMNSLVFTTMKSYFEEASYGKLTIKGNVTDWIDINNSTADYGKDTGTGSKGIDDTDGDGVPDSWKLIRDAINLTDQFINFGQYDDVIVVHSGNDQAKTGIPNDIWSAHYTGLDIVTKDGINITQGILVAETDPVGIFAHEFGHELGLPDLYNVNGSPEYVGPWDLMAMGAWLPSYQGTSPSEPTSWSKNKLGWISENSTGIGRIMEKVIDPLEIQGTNLTVVKIPVTTDTYYMVEVRNKTGFDSYLPSTGILILYVNETRPSGGGIVSVKYSVSLYQATYTTENGRNMFIDNSNNINLTVVKQYSFSYQVKASLIRSDNTPPHINVTQPVPSGWSTSKSAMIRAVITDTGLNSSSVKNASIVFSTDGKTWHTTQMIPGVNDIYTAVIPPQNSSTVYYFVEAYDFAGNLAIARHNSQPFFYGSGTQLVLAIAAVFIMTVLASISVMILRPKRKPEKEKNKASIKQATQIVTND